MKPLVSIVIATYYPNVNFLKQQLNSINQQTYKNIEVLILDDSNNEKEYQKVVECVKKNIFHFPFFIEKNEKNIGSNKTFERLTESAKGQLIAYCDQDDIWLPKKIELLVSKIGKNNLLVYSDLSLINSTNKILYKSFKKSNIRLKHVHGNNTFKFLINRNSVTGCAMLIDAKLAKAAIPFPKQELFVHDHWLAIVSSIYGCIGYIRKPLVLYRVHENNQIGNKRLANINNLRDYKNLRLCKQIEKYKLVKNQVLNDRQLLEVEKSINQVILRLRLCEKISITDFLKLIYLTKNDIILLIFEIIIFNIPEKYANRLLMKIK